MLCDPLRIFGNDVVEIYKTFANIHTDLAPYLLNAGTVCYARNVSVITPMAHRTPFGITTTFDYLLFEDIFVSPFVENTTTKAIDQFPGNFIDEWAYWFDVNKTFTGGQSVKKFDCPFDEYPVFVKRSSIIPLNLQSKHSKLGGSEHSSAYQTIMITRPRHGKYSRQIHEHQADGYSVTYTYDEVEMEMEVHISAHSSNRFNLFINGVNPGLEGLGRPIQASIYRKESDSFVPIDYSSSSAAVYDADKEFWTSSSNLVRVVDSRRVFIKLGESSSLGFIVKIKNV